MFSRDTDLCNQPTSLAVIIFIMSCALLLDLQPDIVQNDTDLVGWQLPWLTLVIA